MSGVKPRKHGQKALTKESDWALWVFFFFILRGYFQKILVISLGLYIRYRAFLCMYFSFLLLRPLPLPWSLLVYFPLGAVVLFAMALDGIWSVLSGRADSLHPADLGSRSFCIQVGSWWINDSGSIQCSFIWSHTCCICFLGQDRYAIILFPQGTILTLPF